MAMLFSSDKMKILSALKTDMLTKTLDHQHGQLHGTKCNALHSRGILFPWGKTIFSGKISYVFHVFPFLFKIKTY